MKYVHILATKQCHVVFLALCCLKNNFKFTVTIPVHFAGNSVANTEGDVAAPKDVTALLTPPLEDNTTHPSNGRLAPQSPTQIPPSSPPTSPPSDTPSLSDQRQKEDVKMKEKDVVEVDGGEVDLTDQEKGPHEEIMSDPSSSSLVKKSTNPTMDRYLDPSRPYKCTICSESFTQKTILLVHFNSVSHLHRARRALQDSGAGIAPPEVPRVPDPRPYRCRLCGVGYSQSSTLDIHLRSVLHQTRARAAQNPASQTSASSLAVPVSVSTSATQPATTREEGSKNSPFTKRPDQHTALLHSQVMQHLPLGPESLLKQHFPLAPDNLLSLQQQLLLPFYLSGDMKLDMSSEHGQLVSPCSVPKEQVKAEAKIESTAQTDEKQTERQSSKSVTQPKEPEGKQDNLPLDEKENKNYESAIKEKRCCGGGEKCKDCGKFFSDALILKSHQEYIHRMLFPTAALEKFSRNYRLQYDQMYPLTQPKSEENLATCPQTPASAPATPESEAAVERPSPAGPIQTGQQSQKGEPHRGRRSSRTRFTEQQLETLQGVFEATPYPREEEYDRLSALLSLPNRVIVVWFQNARQRARKNQDRGTEDGTEGKNQLDSINRQRNGFCRNDDSEDNSCGDEGQADSQNENSMDLTYEYYNQPDSPPAEVLPSLPSAPETETRHTQSDAPSGLSTETQPQNQLQLQTQAQFQCSLCPVSLSSFQLWQEHQTRHLLAAQSQVQLLHSGFTDRAINTLTSLPQSSLTPLKQSAKLIPETSFEGQRGAREIEEEHRRDKRQRTTITPEQLEVLYQRYSLDSNPTRGVLESIARDVGLTRRVVQVWFQNTRARERKGQFRSTGPGSSFSLGLNHLRCPFCRALFKVKSALDAHIKSRHWAEAERAGYNLSQNNGSKEEDDYEEDDDDEFPCEEGSNMADHSSPSPEGSGGPSSDWGEMQILQQHHHHQQQRQRTQMSHFQVLQLRDFYSNHRTPNRQECETLGQELGLPHRVVQVWFQNARAKEKRARSLTVCRGRGERQSLKRHNKIPLLLSTIFSVQPPLHLRSTS
uniref:Zinc finger homeobox 2 n=1 Tax=Echeneis naucrates TaxID=173247 RepID=A0A665VE34_ECHNA